jgi:hypothetical protein
LLQKDERLEEDRPDEHEMQDGEMMVKAVRLRAEGKSNPVGSLLDLAPRGLAVSKANHRLVSACGIAWLTLSR